MSTEETKDAKPTFSFDTKPAEKPEEEKKPSFSFGSSTEDKKDAKPAFSFSFKPSGDKPAFTFTSKPEEKPAEEDNTKPEEDDVKMLGQEGVTVLFSTRSRAFIFNDEKKSWDSRGVGTLRIEEFE